MSGIEDQGLRPDDVEPAPADEDETRGHTSQAEGEDPAGADTHPDPARPGHPSQAEGEDRDDAGATTASRTEEPAPPDDAEEPTTEDLQEPSTEKAPGEEPKAPDRSEPEPSHEAVGIGIIGRPQTEMDEESD